MTVAEGPCAWVPTHTHHCATDLAEWNAYPAPTRTLADQLAGFGLWAATGRRHDACTLVARPVIGCIHSSDVDMAGVDDNPITYAGDREWLVVDTGGACCREVDPFRARLDGPVASVTSVTVDGAVVAPANYRVDDGEWLVRIDGTPWPLWQDLDLNAGVGVFQVTYVKGVPVPAWLLAVAGTYALELARGLCGSSACRLPSRVTEITRNGVTSSFVDPTKLLEKNLTGIPEIDMVITMLNPHGVPRPCRVLVPGATAAVIG
jgi:hypothetical protein